MSGIGSFSGDNKTQFELLLDLYSFSFVPPIFLPQWKSLQRGLIP